jgi:hypothetical protein
MRMAMSDICHTNSLREKGKGEKGKRGKGKEEE